VPNGQSLNLDLSSMTQLSAGYTVANAQVNGNAPSTIDKVTISQDGIVSAQYDDGTMRALYRIPLANVPSPDQLQTLPGNVFAESANSGPVHIGFANDGGFGSVNSGALESSNVDIADELTNMIEAQRSYTANSKVFQTGTDLMDIVVNLKR
jgi:flagellar hook protein FlgE